MWPWDVWSGNMLSTLIMADAIWMALSVIYFRCALVMDSRHAIQAYKAVYTVDRFSTRVIHYMSLVGLLQILSAFLGPGLICVIKVLTILVHTPWAWNKVITSFQSLQAYVDTLNAAQDNAIKYLLCLGVHKVLTRHVTTDVTPIELFASIETFRLRVLLKNALTLWCLIYFRSYDSLYIYYKIAKYVFYYNYGYKFEVMKEQDALQNIQHIIDNRVWAAVSEPIFVHSMVTLEVQRKGPPEFMQHVHWLFIRYMTAWTVLDVTHSVTAAFLIHYVIDVQQAHTNKALFTRSLAAFLTCLFNTCLQDCGTLPAATVLISLDMVMKKDPYRHLHGLFLLAKARFTGETSFPKDYVPVPAYKETHVGADMSNTDADYVLLDTRP